ncbi:MAG: preprotein translocase subunit YajC [Kiritimatiellae bacterium]|nr:preprotein translocase subunit YajC [Kiritimatiellia bacterium]
MDMFLFFAQAAAPASGAPGPAAGGIPGGMLIPMVLIFGIFYLMMIRPQQRKEKERLKMISELRAGQKVLFAGGMIGTIYESKEQSFLIVIAPGTRVEVLRGAVSQVIPEDGSLPSPNAR